MTITLPNGQTIKYYIEHIKGNGTSSYRRRIIKKEDNVSGSGIITTTYEYNDMYTNKIYGFYMSYLTKVTFPMIPTAVKQVIFHR